MKAYYLSQLVNLYSPLLFFYGQTNLFLILITPFNFEKFGTFGDFIGGVVGTVFAFLNVHLLIKTIRLQNNANSQSEKSYAYVQKTENVRTMDTQINSLLSLYNSIVELYHFMISMERKAWKRLLIIF